MPDGTLAEGSARVPRDLLLIAVGVVFILAIGGDPVATLPFWTLVFFGYLVVRLAALASRVPMLLGLVALVVLAWWALRTFPPAVLGPAAVLGLSYAMFRIVHLTVDARDGELGGPLTWRSYLCYLTFAPGYLSGPIHRYQDFTPQVAVAAPPLGAAGRGAVARRAIAGVFKCTVLAGAGAELHRMGIAAAYSNADAGQAALLLAGAAIAFAAWLYFAFAGYMDIAVSAGRALGVVMPENFDHPLRAKNFLDFWSRWHITLSEWFKFYVFNPSLKAMLERTTRPSLAPWLGAVAYFLAFFAMGVWHGRTPELIVYGLVLGAGVSLNKLWQIAMAKRLGKRGYADLSARPAYQACAQALGLAYFVLALAFLWPVIPSPVAMAGAVPLVFLACVIAAIGTRLVSAERSAPVGAEAWIVAALQIAAAAAYLWLTAGAVPQLLYIWL